MADPKTRAEVLDWGVRKIGGNKVVIELEPTDVDDAFDDAIRWYVSRKGIQRRAIVNLIPGVQEYQMTEDCDEIIDLVFPGAQLDIIASINPYAFIDVDQLPVAYSSITGVPGGSFYGTLELILQHAETARRVVGSEPAWEYVKSQNMVQIYPRAQRSGAVLATYISTTLNTVDPTPPLTVPANDFRKLRFRDRDIMLRMFEAQLKWRLARVRGKYTDGMPSAGGNKNMDADTLLGESQQEIQNLNEEIMGLSDPVPFITG